MEHHSSTKYSFPFWFLMLVPEDTEWHVGPKSPTGVHLDVNLVIAYHTSLLYSYKTVQWQRPLSSGWTCFITGELKVIIQNSSVLINSDLTFLSEGTSEPAACLNSFLHVLPLTCHWCMCSTVENHHIMRNKAVIRNPELLIIYSNFCDLM